MRDYIIYDLESFPNIFSFAGRFRNSGEVYVFEISDRVNQRDELITFLNYLINIDIEMVGFNNLGYDYLLLHELLTNPYTFDHNKAYQLTQTIISSMRGGGRGFRGISPNKRYIPQIDIFKICHFDNRAKMTSLKALQFAMRSESLEDLPFEVGKVLSDQEKDVLLHYNIHDVDETLKFFLKNEHLLEMRREYLANGVLQGDVINYPSTKIGIEYFISRLGRNKCFVGGKPRQTMRELIEFKHIILPKIQFRTEPYNEAFQWFKDQKIYVSEKKQPKLKTELCGLEFVFGLGGVHSSAENKIFKTDDDYQIIDSDVTGMYPSIAIANRFAPEHLGEAFTNVYRQIVADRARHTKGTSQNAALKLASNGVYGNSNNPYSPFYDPKYTFSVTVNGQLQLLQLVEMVDLLPDCELIQGNTDGITIRINKKYRYLYDFWCSIWEDMTGLVLEHVEYNRMWIRDVNNYFSETMDGKLKRKGAYWYPLCDKDYGDQWNKDFSNLASKKATEKVLTDSWPLEAAIKLVTDPFDFMLRYKATGDSVVYIGEEKQLKTVRYYVSVSGQPMKKISPAKGEEGQYKRANKLTDEYFNKIMTEIGKDVWSDKIHTKNKSVYAERTTSIQAGWLVKECNVASKFNWEDVDWNYYITEAKKNIIGGY